ncbi:uncharacterized protein LOC128728536 [Anopheles nili]|uniref:uncharacterized protein LOC128728536 n=1 Tax=Anopheles nili TaxID=185578 RepID=UPI00237B1A20|nr:uncharacterized protein LOC128728536 [Anopheles nili]
MASRSVLLVLLAVLAVSRGELSTLFPVDVGLAKENPFMPNERDAFDDCHIRYYRFGKDTTVTNPLSTYDEPREFSHVVAIGWTKSGGTTHWNCKGVLIWNTFVLTSAHCTMGEGNAAPDVVRLGDGNNFPRERKIKEIIRHPNFNPNVGLHDIALLQLESRVDINATAAPTCLWLSQEIPFPLLESLVNTRASRGRKASVMATEKMAVKRKDDCFSFALNESGLPEEQLCTTATSSSKTECLDAKQGDPLQVRLLHNFRRSPFLVGFLSFPVSSGGCNATRVYTRVAPYREWMLQAMQERSTTIKPQDFFPAVCALRYANLRPRVDELIEEVTGELPVYGVQVEARDKEHFNYIVQIEQPQKSEPDRKDPCVGTFIDQRTVLTLAECVDGFQPTNVVHRTKHGNDPTYPVASVHVHPGYVSGSQKNNLAVLKVNKATNPGLYAYTVFPACMWLQDSLPDPRMNLVGYGLSGLNTFSEVVDDDEIEDSGPAMVMSAMNTYSLGNCSDHLGLLGEHISRQNFTDEQHICLRSDQWAVPELCRDLRGGPVQRHIFRAGVYFKYLYALTVSGRTCGNGVPSVAIRLAPHVDWLRSVIFNNTDSQKLQSSSLIIINPDLKRSDECNNGEGSLGICVPQEQCTSTNERLRQGQRVTVCSEGTIVCCSWGDIAKNTSPNPVRTELENCDEGYRAIRKQRTKDILRYTNLPTIADVGWNVNGGEIVFACMGFLITLNTVVTSARCVESYPHKPGVIRIGAMGASRSSDYVLKTVRQVRVHEDYDKMTGINNIALIQLTSPIKANPFHYPGCLYRNQTHSPVRQVVLVKSGEDEIEFSEVSPLYRSECADQMSEPLAPGQLCMKQAQPEAVFRYSSKCYMTGNPAFWNQFPENEDDDEVDILVGLFSHGKCGYDGIEHTQVFTRISAYYDWIVDNAK